MRHLNRANAEAAVNVTTGRLAALMVANPHLVPAEKLVKILLMHLRSIGQDELANDVDEALLDAELVGCPAALPSNGDRPCI